MKFFNVKQFVQYHLPLTFSLFMLITVNRAVTTDGGYDKLYGLPFPYITSGYACSFCHDVYIPALVLNLLFWLALTLLFLKLLQKVGWRLQTNRLLITLGSVISLWWVVLFVFLTYDSRFITTFAKDYQTRSMEISFGLLNPQ